MTIFDLFRPKRIFEKCSIVLLAILSYMYFGLCHRHNVLTEHLDISRDEIQLITYGSTTEFGNLEICLNKKYGFKRNHIEGVNSTSKRKRVEMYDDATFTHIEKPWGFNWREMYETELKILKE